MSQSIIVVYNSKAGFTKKYAEWIANELNCKISENKKLTLEDIKEYDTIICGGGLYAGGISGANLIKKNYEALKDKNLIVFATGATPSRKDDIDKVWEQNFSIEQREHIKCFYMRGGFDYSKLNRGNKILMSLMKKKLEKDAKEKGTSVEEDVTGMLMAFDKPADFTDQKNIEELIECVRNLE